jgi:hypothetical protein
MKPKAGAPADQEQEISGSPEGLSLIFASSFTCL